MRVHAVDGFFEKYLTVISIIIGSILVFIIVPIPSLTASVSDWHASTHPDYSMNLNGFLYFWAEPWHFPLLSVKGLGIPFGFNIFYTDSYPLAALIAKILPLSQAPNIYPACIAAAILLQMVSGTYLARCCGLRSPAALMVGIMLTFMPFFLFRFVHIALANHWIILIGLAETIRHRPGHQGRLVLLSLIALLTHAYLLAMIFPLFLIASLRAALLTPTPARKFLVESMSTVGLMVGLAYSIGLVGHGLTPLPPDNFGQASLNLLSPFIPQRSGLLPGRDIIDATGYQYEGYAYLGAGSLMLMLAAAWIAIRKGIPKLSGPVVLLPLLLGLFWLYALSNRIYLGHHLLLTVDLPDVILKIAAQMRNSGRFFWPVGYALVGLSLFLLQKHLRPAALYGLLGAALVLQIIDAGPMRKVARHDLSDRRTPGIDATLWDRYFAQSQRILVEPPFGCAPMPDWPVIVDLQNVAARKNVPINSLYAARAMRTCDDVRIATEAEPRVPGTLFVFVGPQAASVPRPDLSCHSLRIPRQLHKLWMPHDVSGETELTICSAKPT